MAMGADRSKQQDLCSHLNRRHKAAQHAQRASVNLHTLLFFKNRPSVEAGYVLTVSDQRIGVLVQRFGIEGSIDLQPVAGELNMAIRLDSASHTLHLESPHPAQPISFQVFQKIEISIRVKENGTGDRSLEISLQTDWQNAPCTPLLWPPA